MLLSPPRPLTRSLRPPALFESLSFVPPLPLSHPPLPPPPPSSLPLSHTLPLSRAWKQAIVGFSEEAKRQLEDEEKEAKAAVTALMLSIQVP